MTNASATADLSTPPDPATDRSGKPVPEKIADVLAILHILLIYGRHLAFTLERRAAVRGFSTIAQYFGTARLPAILVRLARGLLRIQALERVLLARAARGRDLVFLQPRRRPRREPQPVPSAADADDGSSVSPPAADAGVEKSRRSAPIRRRDTDAAPDPDNLPTLEQLEAEIRRHPIGRAIADICRDLGVSPSLCEGGLWNALFDKIIWYRGNLPRLIRDFRRREIAFEPEMNADPNLSLPERTREGTRRMLGFFIGQPPATPFWVPVPPELQAAAATGPP